MKVLAFTCSHGKRRFLRRCVEDGRKKAGHPFDWLVVLSAPSAELQADAEALLAEGKIQRLIVYPQNRGQHWATREALAMAREGAYEWLWRVDDDIRWKTQDILAEMLERLRWLKETSGDTKWRIVCSPKVVGLENPLHPSGFINLPGQPFVTEIMEILGGACRLHPMDLLNGYEPNIYDPIGRGDPESIGRHLAPIGEPEPRGLMVRFPDLRVIHRTKEIEALDDEDARLRRRMSKIWCWLVEGA